MPTWEICIDWLKVCQYADLQIPSKPFKAYLDSRPISANKKQGIWSIFEEYAKTRDYNNLFKIFSHDINPINAECPVCQESLKEDYYITCENRNGIHQKCRSQMTTLKCPICRNDI